MDQPKQKNDPLKRIKFIGYSMAILPELISLEDYVRHAKFYLCSKTHRLMKDPIWNEYTQEEIMAEFFAHQFESNKKFLEDFQVDMMSDDGTSDDFGSWADRMIAKEAIARTKVLGGLENKVSFDPSRDVMGEE